MVRALLFFTMCIISTAELGNTEYLDWKIDAPKCRCPHGITSGVFEYCGFELKELNNNASKKVVQTQCQDQFVYRCLKPNQISKISDTCEYSCVKPTSELKAKYTNVANFRVDQSYRWCINFSQSGRYNHTMV